MKDDCISKLTITETGHWANQYKKIVNTLSVLWADKNYRGIKDVLCNGIALVEADFTLAYPDANQSSNTYDIEITTANPTAVILANGSCAQIIMLEQQMCVFNTNLQKQLLSECNQIPKIKSQYFPKFVANKKALMTIIIFR